jgi:hypothetical protein
MAGMIKPVIIMHFVFLFDNFNTQHPIHPIGSNAACEINSIHLLLKNYPHIVNQLISIDNPIIK